MEFCSSCGAHREGASAFCGSCGHRFPEATSVADTQAIPVQPPPPQQGYAAQPPPAAYPPPSAGTDPGWAGSASAPPPQRDSRPGWVVPAAAGAGVLLLAGATYFAISSMRGDDKATDRPTVVVTATVPPTGTSASASAPSSSSSSSAATTAAAAPSTAAVTNTAPGAPAPAPGNPTVDSRAAANAQARNDLNQLRSYSLQGGLNLDGRWIVQLASKYDGVPDPRQIASDGSHIFRYVDILAEHQRISGQMGAKGVNTYLLMGSDFGKQINISSKTYTTIADPGGLYSKADAQSYCSQLFPGLSGKDLQNVCYPRQMTPPHS
ncbi:hypothetical protein ACQP1U_00855 [Actinomycetota bacterium]